MPAGAGPMAEVGVIVKSSAESVDWHEESTERPVAVAATPQPPLLEAMRTRSVPDESSARFESSVRPSM